MTSESRPEGQRSTQPLHRGQEEPDPLAGGSVIADRYGILRMLRGGFGRVYFCTDFVTGRPVALKTLLRKYLASPEMIEMFRKEVLVWIRLGCHPNIVTAYGLEDFMRLPFVVMECMEGGSLEDGLPKGGMAWQTVVDRGFEVACGLEYAGRVCGLVHRDLKPGNVLLSAPGVAKVTDFGLAAVGGEVGEDSVGTPPYMAPEQWDRPLEVSVRSDVYAFGVMLFELSTGERPFPDHVQPLEYCADHLYRPVPEFGKSRPDLPAFFVRLVTSCLAKDPDERPHDFTEVRRQLEPFTQPRPDPPPAPDPEGQGLVNLARTMILLGRLEDARAGASEAVRRDPASAEAHVVLGNALGELHRYPEALAELAMAHDLDPARPEPLVNSALYAARAGEPALARLWLDRALEALEPRQLEGVTQLLTESGRIPEAIALCGRILERNPLAVIAWNNLAVALRRSGDLEGALACASRAVELNPRYAKGWSNRATVLVQLGRFQEAVTAADAALDGEPGTAGAYAAKAAALRELGQRERALACLREGLRELPGNPLLTRALNGV